MMADERVLNGEITGLNGLASDTLSNSDRQSGSCCDGSSAKVSCHASACSLDGDNISDVEIRPDPGYVIKGSTRNGVHVFINVSKCIVAEKPFSAKHTAPTGRLELAWTIPHIVMEQQADGSTASNCNQRCRIFDFVVHPDTYRMAETNAPFKNMLTGLVLKALCEDYDVPLTSSKLRFPKMKYKNVAAKFSRVNWKLGYGGNMIGYDKCKAGVTNCTSKQVAGSATLKSDLSGKSGQPKAQIELESKQQIDAKNDFTVPQYTVTLARDEQLPAVNGCSYSRMLVMNIELPLLSSASTVNLDIFDKKLLLVSLTPFPYRLDVNLPCIIDENYSVAKFSRSKKVLRVNMPVVHIAGDSELPHNPDYQYELKHVASDSAESPSYDSGIDVHPFHESGNDADTVESTVPESEENNIAEMTCNAADITGVCNDTDLQVLLMQFTEQQDMDTVSFIFPVRNVTHDSVLISELSDNMCRIEVSGTVEGNELCLRGCCLLKFDDNCEFISDGYTVNTSEVNVVVVIYKSPHCCGMWNSFWAGTAVDNLEKREFLTANGLMAHLDALDIARDKTTGIADQALIAAQVIQLDDNKLEIVLQATENAAETDLSDIVVVHEKAVPKLHSILKQRTMSESSDDIQRMSLNSNDRQTSTTGSEGEDADDSPDWPPADRNGRVLKKSVSFSSHIDHTLFQANQSVSSMHAALKNRRRRARKREQKQEQKQERRRRRSSGSFSMEESGDERPELISNHGGHVSSASADRNDLVPNSRSTAGNTDEEVFPGQPAQEFECYENVETVQHELQRSKSMPVEIRSEYSNYTDEYRTKDTFSTEKLRADVVNSFDACDGTPVFLSGVDCASASSISNETCDLKSTNNASQCDASLTGSGNCQQVLETNSLRHLPSDVKKLTGMSNGVGRNDSQTVSQVPCFREAFAAVLNSAWIELDVD